MTTKLKSIKKSLAIFLAIFVTVNTVLPGRKTKAAEPATIASWDCTAAPTTATIPATNGTHKDGAVLSSFRSDITKLAYSTGSYSIDKWTNSGSFGGYWQLQLSTSGYDSLTLSASVRSSGTGPKDFKVIYSVTNGASWNDVPGGTYAVSSSLLKVPSDSTTFTLPSAAADQSNLLIRFINTSTVSVNGPTIADGGTSQINHISLVGTPISSSSIVGGITASPSGSAVALGSKVALACDTAGATINYSTDDGKTYQAYDPSNQITLSTLPVTIKAYGTESGMRDGQVSTFNYTQAQVQAVTATPNGGAVALNTNVLLSCATPNSVIKYSTDNGSTWNDYTSGIKLDKLPAVIKAKATAAGTLDSSESTFSYTQKINEDYNTYFGQLHSHTTNSDGIGTLDDAYSHARDTAHLDFFAVTDHSNYFDNGSTSSLTDGSKSTSWINGHNAADKYTVSNFIGIYAFEMTWSDGTGHINTFNTPGFETRDNATYKAADGLQQYYNVLKKSPNSISQFNHPGTTFGDFKDFANYDADIDKLITLIEVGNGEGAIGSAGYFPSYSYYDRALQKGWHVAPTNNQDNHKGLWGDANTARTVILADSLTRDNIYDAIRNRRTYATEDNDLRIKYTLNDSIMGTILDQKPGSVDIKVNLEDPDKEALGKVSVIADGGKEVTSKTLTTSKDSVEFQLTPDYSYYYIKVVEADGDIAVTAPVWIGDSDKAGINNTTASTSMPIKDKKFTVTTNLYNNGTQALKIKSLQYSIDGNNINTAPALADIAPLGTNSYSFDYTPTAAGKYNIDVKLTATIDGVDKVFTDVLKLNVADPAVITNVLIDGSHYNDYVNGYYAGNMKNITTLANNENINVIIQKDKLTDDALKDVSLLILSPTAKKAGTDKNTGTTYSVSSYTDDEIAVIKRYADKGGNIIVTGLADYQDSRTDATAHTAYQQNRILSAIGADSRIDDDEVVDYDNNPNVNPPGKAGGTPYRIPMNNYNTSSPYLKGVVSGQNYSFYSGCSVTPGKNANLIVKGFPSTYGFDSDNDKLGGSYVSSAASAMPADTGIGKGNMVALVVETLSGGGKLFVGGTVFYSDFEIKASLDNYSQLQNSNYNIMMNILDSIKKDIPVTPINKVRTAQKGDEFCVEGIATVGVTSTSNTFTDTIYVQDSTGGINLYPVSGKDIKIGQKIKVTGTLDQYQGDTELRVIDVTVTDPSINPVAPAVMTTKDAMDSNNGGELIKVQGTVTKVDTVNSVVSAIYVKDQSGVEARLYIDGYLGYSDANSAKIEDIAKVGNVISGIGLASTDPVGNRLRVRDKSEIALISAPVTPTPIVTPTPAVTPIPVVTPTPAVTPAPTVASTVTPAPRVTPAPTVTPVPTVNPTPTVTPVSAATSNASASMMNSDTDSVVTAITNAISNGTQIPAVDVTSSPVVSKDVFNAIKGHDRTITFTGTNVSWTFNGKDISSDVPNDIDLSLKAVTIDLKSKEAAKIKAVTGKDIPVVSFSFNYEGPLPGMATVKVFISKDWANKTVDVCRYYSDKNTYEIIQSNVKIDSDGYASYNTNHCSDYFVIDTAAAPDMPQTGSMVDTSLLISLSAVAIFAGTITTMSSKKRKKVK